MTVLQISRPAFHPPQLHYTLSTSPTHPLQLRYSQYFSIFYIFNPSSTAPLYSRVLHFLNFQPILHSSTILKSSQASTSPTYLPQLHYTLEFSIFYISNPSFTAPLFSIVLHFLNFQPIFHSSILQISPFSTSPTHPLQFHYTQQFSIFQISNPSSKSTLYASPAIPVLHFLNLKPILHIYTTLLQ